MSTYRTLGCLPAPCLPQQVMLAPEDCLRVARRTAVGGVAVCHAMGREDLDRLCAELPAGLVADRGTKHATRPLAWYFADRGGLVCLRADYRAPAQALRGLHALVATCNGPLGGLFFVGLPAAVFADLWTRAAPLESPEPQAGGLAGYPSADSAEELQALLARHADLAVPAKVSERYVGASRRVEWVRRQIVLAARGVHPVLIQGEAGTGKELVARLIHELSDRQAGALQVVNCDAIPEEGFESELFGQVRGAVPGAARDRAGLWTQARGSTLFLSEIGDVSLLHQVKVLRALQTGRYLPVGGEQEIESNARVIAASHGDLEQLVRAGRFREDLFYRLFSLRIRLPALREQREDIPEIARRQWRKVAGEQAPALADEVTAELSRQPWPGNVRELRAFLANVAVVAGGQPVTAELVRAVQRERHTPQALVSDT